MIEFVFGMLGALAALAAFALGVCLERGSWRQGAPVPCPGPGEPPAARREDEELMTAFEAMMHYNSETAYGMNREVGEQ